MNPDTETSPSRAAVGGSVGMNSDILIEILLHLPEKTITRLKLVSKHWFSVISSNEFRRLRSRRYTLLLQSRRSNFFKILPFDETPILSPHTFPLRNPKILSHCNGLMLLESQNYYYVHNPTTTQSRRILLDYSEDYPCIKGFTLAFDPSKPTRYTITLVRAAFKPFELDESSSDSKRSFRIDLYKSVSRVWKIGSEPFEISPEPRSFSGVHCNNLIYWNVSGRIWYYDIGNDIVSTLPTNPGSDGSEIQESNGNIFIMNRLRETTVELRETVQLWELQENKDWSIKYEFRIRCPPPLIARFWIRFEEEMSSLVYQSDGKIMVYSFVDGNFREVVNLRDQEVYFRHVDGTKCSLFASFFLFDETLALV